MAVRCYFVSEANRRLAEKQIGTKLVNAEILSNPFNVQFNASPSWPSGEAGELRLACVGRLHPPSKGQDILLEALAGYPWDTRQWRLTLYGEGRCIEGLRRLTANLGLAARVEFAGFVGNIEDVWAAHHVLTLPSRFEGLPMAMVEAMLCGRPVIATDVGGHSEVIEDGVTGFLAKAATVDAFRNALEEAWQRRFDLRKMGELAAMRIRQLIPDNPIKVFSERIMKICEARSSDRGRKPRAEAVG
jgi:glycosyltransferase involved in cell wall biosynthesis